MKVTIQQRGLLKKFNPTTKADSLRSMTFQELTTQAYLLKQDSAPTLVRVENDALVPLLDLVLAEC